MGGTIADWAGPDGFFGIRLESIGGLGANLAGQMLAEAGVPQPRFAAARDLASARAAAETVGFPAVLKPADSGGQRGVFRLDSIDDLDGHLHAALAESAEGKHKS
mgnify:CR=1 FL=1